MREEKGGEMSSGSWGLVSWMLLGGFGFLGTGWGRGPFSVFRKTVEDVKMVRAQVMNPESSDSCATPGPVRARHLIE